MRFINKILDVFKLESTKEMENTRETPASETCTDINRTNKLSDIAYNDRFYEDYRPVMRKTVAFTGNNFSNGFILLQFPVLCNPVFADAVNLKNLPIPSRLRRGADSLLAIFTRSHGLCSKCKVLGWTVTGCCQRGN